MAQLHPPTPGAGGTLVSLPLDSQGAVPERRFQRPPPGTVWLPLRSAGNATPLPVRRCGGSSADVALINLVPSDTVKPSLPSLRRACPRNVLRVGGRGEETGGKKQRRGLMDHTRAVEPARRRPPNPCRAALGELVATFALENEPPEPALVDGCPWTEATVVSTWAADDCGFDTASDVGFLAELLELYAVTANCLPGVM